MKIERTKNAGRNIFFGMLQRFYSMIIPFLLRSVVIYFMGIQYLGLNSIFSSVISMLSLAELGVGSAMVYSMYQPIIDDDTETICALMNLYRKYYRIIGLVIGTVGLILLPFIPHIVRDDVPGDLNIYLLYLFYLGETVLSYWLFAYKHSLLHAYQRKDVISKVSLLVSVVKNLLQYLVLLFFRNYYLYIAISLISQIAQNVFTAYVTDRLYPGYHPRGTLSREKVNEINRRIRDLFTSMVSGKVVYSSDSIVISAFLGLSVLAVYQNYFYILTALIALMQIIYSACMAGIGNSIIVESKEKNYNDLKKMTFLIVWITGVCTCSLLCLYQPFMRIWMNHDENLILGMGEVICLCVYYYVFQINRVINTYKDSAGIWHKDRFRPLTNAVVNLLLNLILVQFWGLYGVLLSTVIAFLAVEIPWLIYNLFTTIFEKKHLWEYVRSLFFYSGVTLAVCVVTYVTCLPFHLNDLWRLLVNGSVCFVLSNLLFFLAFCKRPEFYPCMEMINQMTRRKIPLLNRVKGKAV